ncbi:MAG: methylenetetrahydrofolate reductase [NAD(P)H] [Candidatus Polarisedimenticolaceae bacterium]|nr:methylenetetrahydrofolate reductase [NAD(P)H] [Candidatus Polarisedimenticolaceae bacterium]
MQSQKKYQPTYSFEVFPPKTEQGAEKLRGVCDQLMKVNPLYISVTYGAGGTTRDRTIGTVLAIQKTGINAAPHLSCIGSSKEEILGLLELYKGSGIDRIVALRGDLPSGMGAGESGDFRYANELVEFIRHETGDHFCLEVAAYPEFHPQATDSQADLKNFKRKIDAGANGAITQYFFNADAYLRFVDDCEKLGIDTPIMPGIMPITNFTQLARFSDGCGTEIPRWLRKRLEDYGDDLDSIRSLGLDVISSMCQRLLDEGAPGLHFYSMNQADPVLGIWKNLGLPGAGLIGSGA